jgi:hypothetical protein
VRKRLEEPRNKRKCRGRMNKFTKVISLLIHRELMDRLAMRAEVMTTLGMVHLVWLARGVINLARFSRCITVTVYEA